MAIVNLGDYDLTVGQGQIPTDMFEYDEKKAYCLYLDMSLSSVNNVFSVLDVRTWAVNDDYGTFIADNDRTFIIQPGRTTYLVPFSKVYGGSGNAYITLERRSIFTGGASFESELNVEVLYDDKNDENTWLA